LITYAELRAMPYEEMISLVEFLAKTIRSGKVPIGKLRLFVKLCKFFNITVKKEGE